MGVSQSSTCVSGRHGGGFGGFIPPVTAVHKPGCSLAFHLCLGMPGKKHVKCFQSEKAVVNELSKIFW